MRGELACFLHSAVCSTEVQGTERGRLFTPFVVFHNVVRTLHFLIPHAPLLIRSQLLNMCSRVDRRTGAAAGAGGHRTYRWPPPERGRRAEAREWSRARAKRGRGARCRGWKANGHIYIYFVLGEESHGRRQAEEVRQRETLVMCFVNRRFM